MYDIKALYEAKSVPDAIGLLLAHPQAKVIAAMCSCRCGRANSPAASW